MEQNGAEMLVGFKSILDAFTRYFHCGEERMRRVKYILAALLKSDSALGMVQMVAIAGLREDFTRSCAIMLDNPRFDFNSEGEMLVNKYANWLATLSHPLAFWKRKKALMVAKVLLEHNLNA